jgi:L-asparaginase II
MRPVRDKRPRVVGSGKHEAVPVRDKRPRVVGSGKHEARRPVRDKRPRVVVIIPGQHNRIVMIISTNGALRVLPIYSAGMMILL